MLPSFLLAIFCLLSFPPSALSVAKTSAIDSDDRDSSKEGLVQIVATLRSGGASATGDQTESSQEAITPAVSAATKEYLRPPSESKNEVGKTKTHRLLLSYPKKEARRSDLINFDSYYSQAVPERCGHKLTCLWFTILFYFVYLFADDNKYILFQLN